MTLSASCCHSPLLLSKGMVAVYVLSSSCELHLLTDPHQSTNLCDGNTQLAHVEVHRHAHLMKPFDMAYQRSWRDQIPSRPCHLFHAIFNTSFCMFPVDKQVCFHGLSLVACCQWVPCKECDGVPIVFGVCSVCTRWCIHGF